MFALHQTVALTHDIPDAGLQLGVLGAVVAIHDPETYEVELSSASLRAIGDQDLIAVRSLATAKH